MSQHTTRYVFESFTFEPDARRLICGAAVNSLSPKAAQLLHLLVERAGDFVSKQEIFETVWKDTFVEDGVLTQNIYSLRKLLGTNADGQQLIENRARLGYRLNAEMAAVAEPDSTTTAVTPSRTFVPALRYAVPIVSLLLLVLVVAAAWQFGYRGERQSAEPVSLVFRQVTNTGDITTPTISPEGDFAAFARDKWLYLRDLRSANEIKLNIPGVTSFSSVQFSADGSLIMFRPHMVMRTDANILSVSRLGGATRVVAEKTWGSFGVSNDGSRIVFGRNHPAETAQSLVVKTLSSGDEAVVTRIQFPEIFLHNSSPVFSPDDKKIAFVTQNYMARQTALYVVDVETGERTAIKPANLRQFEQVGFMPNGEGMIVSASEGGRFLHLWKIVPGEANAIRMTNGLTSFGEIAFARDGTVLALQTTERPGIFTAPADDLKNQSAIADPGADFAGQTGLEWIDEDQIVYSAYSFDNPMTNIFRHRVSTNETKALTTDRNFHSDAPSSTGDGNSIFFTTTESQILNIRRVDGEGASREAATNGTDGYRIFPQVTQDGRYLYYIFRSLGGGEVIRRDLTDGSEAIVVPRTAANPVGKLALSPDGTRLAFINWGDTVRADNDEATYRLGVVSINDPTNVKFFDVKLLIAAIQTSPDGSALDYVSFDANTSILKRQPIDGGQASELLRIPDRRLYNFAWSKQGKRLALSHGVQQRDAVLLSGF